VRSARKLSPTYDGWTQTLPSSLQNTLLFPTYSNNPFFYQSIRFNMDASVAISPCESCPAMADSLRVSAQRGQRLTWHIAAVFPALTALALAGVLCGIILVSLGVFLIHFILLRRKARRSSLRHLDGLPRGQSASRARWSDSDSDSSDMDPSRSRSSSSSSEKGPHWQASLNLKPNQPVFVDVESDNGSQAGLQLILTPPTPSRSR
jgi:hypothetical protein